jgi:hypothetical protein
MSNPGRNLRDVWTRPAAGLERQPPVPPIRRRSGCAVKQGKKVLAIDGERHRDAHFQARFRCGYGPPQGHLSHEPDVMCSESDELEE